MVMQYALGRIQNKKLTGLVIFTTVRGPIAPNGGFPEFKFCSHPGSLEHYVFLDGDIVPSDHQSCWAVQNIYTEILSQWADKNIKLDNVEKAAGGDLAAKGVPLPQDMVQVRFGRSNTSSFIEFRAMFSPDAEGILSNAAPTAVDSDWSVSNIKRYPEKVAYIAKMKAWGETYWPRFKQAFDQAADTPAP